MSKAMANRTKCVILYASQTGRSERYAKKLCDLFNKGFNAKVKTVIYKLGQFTVAKYTGVINQHLW